MAMNFPKDGLVDGVTTYRWEDIEYIWKGGRWQSNKVVGANSATNLRDQLADPDSNLLIGGVSVKDLVGRSLSAPLFTVEWFPSREAIQGGYIAADGSVLPRGAYKEAWEGIAARKVPVIPDTDWEAYPEKQGCYTEGDGSSTFRIPDLNGKNLTSYGPAYLGGEGPNITASGRILRDQLQNITGDFGFTYGLSWVESIAHPKGPHGAFYGKELGSLFNSSGGGGGGTDYPFVLGFDASRVARTGETTRPITAEGVWCIKLYHKVINEGSVDVEQAVADIAAIDTRVNALEKWQTWTNATYVPDNVSSTPVDPGTPMSNTIAHSVGINPLEVRHGQGLVIKDSGYYRVRAAATIQGGFAGQLVLLRNGATQWVQAGTWGSSPYDGVVTFEMVDAFNAGELIDMTTLGGKWFDRRHWHITIERIG